MDLPITSTKEDSGTQPAPGKSYPGGPRRRRFGDPVYSVEVRSRSIMYDCAGFHLRDHT